MGEVLNSRPTWKEFEDKVNEWCDSIESKAKIKNKDVKLWFKEGKKYYKIFTVIDGNEKVHAIIDRSNGNIFKYPKKNQSKYNLFLNYKDLIDCCEFTGSYLK